MCISNLYLYECDTGDTPSQFQDSQLHYGKSSHLYDFEEEKKVELS